MMMKAVAYYRSRPCEPEASDLALRLQREAVRRTAEKNFLDVVAEFVKREGEAGSETCPAYVAAVHAALAQRSSEDLIDVALLIATDAAIGTGETFDEPNIEGSHGLLHFWIGARLIPALPEIALPAGAPGPLCLYADYRPRQRETLVYLCNARPDPLAEVTVVTDTIDMGDLHNSKPGERWAEASETGEQHWDTVPPGTCVLLNTLGHMVWDMVNRHRMTFTDAAGQRWTAEVVDMNLNACQLSQDPDEVWATFRPACPADQAGAGEQLDKVS